MDVRFLWQRSLLLRLLDQEVAMIFKTTINFYQMDPAGFTDEQAAMVLNLFPAHAFGLGRWREKGKETYFAINEEVANINDVLDLGIPSEHINLKPLPRLTMMRDKFRKLNSAIPDERRAAGDTYQVNLPGFDLLAMREIGYREDACTEDVDALLKQGWSILAILPQPNHRRPDYIIGRTSRERS